MTKFLIDSKGDFVNNKPRYRIYFSVKRKYKYISYVPLINGLPCFFDSIDTKVLIENPFDQLLKNNLPSLPAVEYWNNWLNKRKV